MTTAFGRTFFLDGFTLPAHGSIHLALLPSGISMIASVTVHTPEGETSIQIPSR